MSGRLFSPSSVFWQVNREFAIALAGPRAVLMQIAHPLVAAGVAEHSQFRKHRLARLYRTSVAAMAITFGNRDFVIRAMQSINRKHRQVHGALRTAVGPFEAGTPYDANDPELKLWVLATITESTLLVYETFVAPLSSQDRESYYQDSLKGTRLFGIPDAIVPPTYGEFRLYMDRMMQSGVITVGADAREIARALFARTPSGLLLHAGSLAGIGLLPPRLRREFDFQWTERREHWLRKAAAASSRVRRHLPAALCCSPVATVSELLAAR